LLSERLGYPGAIYIHLEAGGEEQCGAPTNMNHDRLVAAAGA